MNTRLELRRQGPVQIVSFRDGDVQGLDEATRLHLAETVPHSKFVVIDFSGCESLDWEDLGILMAVKKAHRSRWGTHMNHFKVVVRPGKIRDMIKDIRMEHILPSYRSLEDALATFPTRRAFHIEPEDGAAGIVEIVLENHGFEVLRYRSPDEIPPRADAGRVDIILTVVDFDRGEDVDLVRRLRLDYGVPVGVVSSRTGLEAEGAAFVIEKPIDPERLIQQIERLGRASLEDYYHALLDYVPLPLCIIALTGEVIFVNRGWRDLLRVHRPDAHDLTLAGVLPADWPDRDRMEEEILKKAQAGGPAEWRPGPGASPGIALSISPALFDKEARILLTASLGEGSAAAWGASLESGTLESQAVLLSLLEDLDASRRKLEEANERLRALDRLKSEFVSTVSHELRTPLTAIKGSVENMLDGFVGATDVRHRRTLEVVLRNAKRLARLIDNLLDLSRLEAGTLKIRAKEIDLRAPIRQAYEDLLSIAERGGVKIQLRLPEMTVTVASDWDRIVQIATNLLDNAIRFAAKEVTVELTARDGEARLVVEDDGPGIPPEDLERVFERFSHARSRPDKVQTGIGLSIVQGIVHAHGGTVRAENRARRDGTADSSGARFSVFLPLTAARSEEEKAA